MEVLRKEITFGSSNGEHYISAYVWYPKNTDKAKALFQIVHGMAEHKERYNEFANYMASNGYIVFMNDHAGHGASVLDESKLGYFAKQKGHNVVIKDVRKLYRIVSKRYASLPHIIMGHSMGSFIARNYTRLYSNDLTAAIFMGTSAGNPFINVVLALARIGIKSKGELKPGANINKLAFGAFNKRITPHKTEFDWVSSDEQQVQKYIDDPKCGFLFTNSGYRDLFMLIKNCNKKEWYKNISDDLPILLISGEDDPVGDYGKGILKIYEQLNFAGKDVEVKLYNGCRHEVLNETNKDEVYEFLLNWTDGIVVKR